MDSLKSWKWAPWRSNGVTNYEHFVIVSLPLYAYTHKHAIFTGETFVTRKVSRSVAQIHLGYMESVSSRLLGEGASHLMYTITLLSLVISVQARQSWCQTWLGTCKGLCGGTQQWLYHVIVTIVLASGNNVCSPIICTPKTQWLSVLLLCCTKSCDSVCCNIVCNSEDYNTFSASFCSELFIKVVKACSFWTVGVSRHTPKVAP